ncbi:TlpA disulfide reductase family protein [Deferribacter thermophilus]|uniref:TlpA family protein disulfide reductase n=1 Tax=Deferribacter thermophilus TaxID=53573 RepID=UPI003C16C4DD
MKRKILGIFILILAFAFIVSCSKTEQSSNKKIVSSLEELNLVQFKQLKNQHAGKVILVNFFASWCPPCNEETPGFVKVYNKLKDKGFVIIGLSIDDNIDDAVNFVNKYGITYPVYHADRGLESYFNIRTIPTNIFYDKKGNLYNLHVGAIDEKNLEKYIESLLAQ